MGSNIIRRVSVLLVAVGYLAAATESSFADKRVALVIGNAAYQNVPMLGNTTNDAEAVSLLFKNLGFDVVRTYMNLEVRELRRAISDFSDATSDADIAVVYYAGHGIEVDGNNYLIPVDARLRRDVDVDDDAVPLDRILKIVEPARRLRLVILDACRDNPFSKTMRRTITKRGIGRGLASLEPVKDGTCFWHDIQLGSLQSQPEYGKRNFSTPGRSRNRTIQRHAIKEGMKRRRRQPRSILRKRFGVQMATALLPVPISER
jgi:hypothetical protein